MIEFPNFQLHKHWAIDLSRKRALWLEKSLPPQVTRLVHCSKERRLRHDYKSHKEATRNGGERTPGT